MPVPHMKSVEVVSCPNSVRAKSTPRLISQLLQNILVITVRGTSSFFIRCSSSTAVSVTEVCEDKRICPNLACKLSSHGCSAVLGLVSFHLHASCKCGLMCKEIRIASQPWIPIKLAKVEQSHQTWGTNSKHHPLHTQSYIVHKAAQSS